MATKNWIDNGTNADFNVAADWGGVLPTSGDTADVGAGEVEISATDVTQNLVPTDLTFGLGALVGNMGTTPTSILSLTDLTTPAGMAIDDTLSGGAVTPTGTSPVVAAELAVNGQVDFTGDITVGSGDSLWIGIASDSPSSPATTGVFDNTGTINVTGSLVNYGFLLVSPGNENGDSGSKAYADYGTVNLSDGVLYAEASDGSAGGAVTGQINLSNYSELAIINHIFNNTAINFQDNTDQLLLGQDGSGGFANYSQIAGFQTGDVIGLLSNGVAPVSLSYSYSGNNTGTLSIYDSATQNAGTLVGTLNLTGNYSSDDFTLTQDSSVEVAGYSTQYNIAIAPAPTVSVTITGNAGAPATSNFNQFLGFGDSNIDSGYFSNTPVMSGSSAGANLPTSVGGTMNSTILADDFGLSAAPYNPNTGNSGSPLGTNYAASGATVTGSVTNGWLAPSITSQISTYLDSTPGGDTANPDALYLLAGGANDATLASEMTTAQGEAYMVAQANTFAASIEQLHSDGAQYIIIDNMTGPTADGALFNATLDTDLANAGVAFIDGNTRGLISTIEANPVGSLYGVSYDFTNVAPPTSTSNTGANVDPNPSLHPTGWSLWATTLTSPNAGSTDLWADNQHLAAVGQQIEAAYYENLIETATPTVGETLTANPVMVNGTASNDLYQWQALESGTWTNVSAQTSSPTYVVTSANVGDELRVETTMTDSVSGATESVNSDPTFDVIPCFCRGVRITTDRGDVAVEQLRRGDLVATHDGRLTPVSWIGVRKVSRRFSDPLRLLPIRVKAGALADNVPARDLLISPDHALYLQGVLVHAGALVNATSIVRETEMPEIFVYYHVETDAQTLILAENVPAETFVDNVDRMNFDNWAEHEALYPEGKAVEEMPYPRAKARRQVPMAIRVALDERAQILGAVPAAVA